MTTKKLLIILIVAITSLLSTGLAIFLITNSNKTIYANSISANVAEINLSVGDEIYIFDKIKFDIKPNNCTQSISFSILNNTNSVCSLDTTTRRIIARKVGQCTLRANIKSGQTSYISTSVLINVVDNENPSEIYATNITKLKNNVILKTGENINLNEIFTVSPQNCNQNAEILINLSNICQYDESTNLITATNQGHCVATIKIKSSESTFAVNQIDIIVCENQKTYNFEKTLTYNANENNVFVINITEDIPELADIGKVDFVESFDENLLEIIENESNIFKILCKTNGNHQFILENNGYKITYNFIAKINQLENTNTETDSISLSVGDNFDLTQIQFESLPTTYQIDYTLSNNNASINNNVLTALEIGNCDLNIKISSDSFEKEFVIQISISKRIVNYQIEANQSQEYIQINLYQNQDAQTYMPNIDLADINIENESIVVKENINNGILTLLIYGKGNTNISIISEKMEIVIEIVVK